MIYHHGNVKPSKNQLAHARKWADESFCRNSEPEFFKGAPSFGDLIPAESGATLLRLRNVEPHDDPWVGRYGIKDPMWEQHEADAHVEFEHIEKSAAELIARKHRHEFPWDWNGPKERRAIFWVLHSPKELHVQCGTKAQRMVVGDWIVLDDTITHCVVASSMWIGASWQLMPWID